MKTLLLAVSFVFILAGCMSDKPKPPTQKPVGVTPIQKLKDSTKKVDDSKFKPVGYDKIQKIPNPHL